MPNIPDEILYDVRLIERHVRQGTLERTQVDKRLKDLKDVASDGEVLNLEHVWQNLRGERHRDA
jgi:hypothetical protein